MRHLASIAILAAVGVSAAACSSTYTTRTYDSGYTTQYVTAPGYTYSSGYPVYTTQYVMGPSYAYRYDRSPYGYSYDRDRDGVPNWRDARPDNPYRY